MAAEEADWVQAARRRGHPVLARLIELANRARGEREVAIEITPHRRSNRCEVSSDTTVAQDARRLASLDDDRAADGKLVIAPHLVVRGPTAPVGA
jgi:hypothetical protein